MSGEVWRGRFPRHIATGILMKKILITVFLFTFVPLWATSRAPAPEILGIRLGMDYARAHTLLTKLGHFKSEDERQEVWVLRRDKRYEYLIVGFDRDHTVRYVTALARPQGEPVDYTSIGDLTDAERAGTTGNVRYIWRPKKHPDSLEYIVIAKGQAPHRLTIYSVKRIAATEERDLD
jgi:hypothetical protein